MTATLSPPLAAFMHRKVGYCICVAAAAVAAKYLHTVPLLKNHDRVRAGPAYQYWAEELKSRQHILEEACSSTT